MPTGESAGGVYVTIDGDGSPLIAEYARVEAASRAAGIRIAAGLGQGLSAASGIVDQFGRSVTSSLAAVTPAANQAAASFTSLGTVMRQEGAAGALAAQRLALGLEQVRAAADQTSDEIVRLSVVIQQESAAATLAAQRNLAMAGSLNQVGSGAAGAGRAMGLFIYAMAARLGWKFGELAYDFLNIRDAITEATKALNQMDADAEKSVEHAQALQVQILRNRVGAVQAAQAEAKNNTDRLITLPQPNPENLKQLPDKDVQGILDATTSLQGGDIPARIAKVKKDLADARADYEALSKPVSVPGSDPATKLGITLGTAVGRGRSAKQADEMVAMYGETLRLLQAKQKEFDAQGLADSTDVGRQKAEAAGRLRLTQLAGQEQADQQSTKMAQSLAEREEMIAHAKHQADIDAMADRQAAVVASAEEEVRAAKQKEARINADLAANIAYRLDMIREQGAAEELGKTPEQISAIRQTTQNKQETLKSDDAQQQIDAHTGTIDALNRLDEARATYAREQIDNVARYQLKQEEDIQHDTEELGRLMAETVRKADEASTRSANLAQRTGQLQAQKSGVTAESDNEVAKLRAQQAYALQIVHTKQQELQYAAQMAAFDERALQLKIATAEAELFKAVAEQNLIPTSEGTLKIDEDSLKVAQAKAALMKQQIEDQTKIIELKQKISIEDQLQIQLTQQAEGIAKSVGDALAAGIAGPHKKKTSIGQDIGNDIVKALKSTGQHALGDLFTAGIKEALEASGVNKAAAKLGGVIFGTPAHAGPGGTTVAATGGILGKLAGALHIPGVGVKPAGTPSSPAVVTGSQNTAQAAATRSATQIQQIATTTQQQERTLQQILSALTSSSCACEERQTQALTAEGAKQTALLGAIAAGIVTMTGIEILQLIKPSVLGFSAAAGGYVPHDMIGQVHAGEHVLTAGQVLGNEALPNLPALAGRGIGSTSFSNAMSVNSASNSFSVGAIHLHGVRDMQDVARRLPNVLKAASSSFQPASS